MVSRGRSSFVPGARLSPASPIQEGPGRFALKHAGVLIAVPHYMGIHPSTTKPSWTHGNV